jgi:hypothetical protein
LQISEEGGFFVGLTYFRSGDTDRRRHGATVNWGFRKGVVDAGHGRSATTHVSGLKTENRGGELTGRADSLVHSCDRQEESGPAGLLKGVEEV